MMKKFTLLFLGILIFLSCEPESGLEDIILDYTIKNESTHIIKLKVFDLFVQESNIYYDTTYLLFENSEIVFQYKNLSSIDGVFGPAADSTDIIFDDIKHLKYKRDDGKNGNIFDIKNWNVIIANGILYKYEYSITDEDNENADLIE